MPSCRLACFMVMPRASRRKPCSPAFSENEMNSWHVKRPHLYTRQLTRIAISCTAFKVGLKRPSDALAEHLTLRGARSLE
eukprot:4079585-Prymnesium_polylepis.1